LLCQAVPGAVLDPHPPSRLPDARAVDRIVAGAVAVASLEPDELMRDLLHGLQGSSAR
jgi:hypothetical protein